MFGHNLLKLVVVLVTNSCVNKYRNYSTTQIYEKENIYFWIKAFKTFVKTIHG